MLRSFCCLDKLRQKKSHRALLTLCEEYALLALKFRATKITGVHMFRGGGLNHLLQHKIPHERKLKLSVKWRTYPYYSKSRWPYSPMLPCMTKLTTLSANRKWRGQHWQNHSGEGPYTNFGEMVPVSMLLLENIRLSCSRLLVLGSRVKGLHACDFETSMYPKFMWELDQLTGLNISTNAWTPR